MDQSDNNQSLIPSIDLIQLTSTLKMTTTQVVEMSVTAGQQHSYSVLNSPRRSCSTYLLYEMTLGFKPFTVTDAQEDLELKGNLQSDGCFLDPEKYEPVKFLGSGGFAMVKGTNSVCIIGY